MERLVGILLTVGEGRGTCQGMLLVTVACEVERGMLDDADEVDRSRWWPLLGTAVLLLRRTVEGTDLLRPSSSSSSRS